MATATLSRFAIFLVLCACVIAAPLRARGKDSCPDGRDPPCICNGALGLRLGKPPCPNQSLQFTDPASPTDGSLSLVPGNVGLVQCDHIVELQFIANEIAKVPAICAHFTAPAGQASFKTFFDTINADPNLIEVESTVNNAKGKLFDPKFKNFKATTQKAANGVINYLELLKANGAKKVNPGTHVATVIDTAMTTAVGAGNGFLTGFQTRFNALITNGITKTQGQVAKLIPLPTPGDPFVNETPSTIARCQRGLWSAVHNFVVRKITGKPTTTAAQCALPVAKKPAVPKITKPKAVTKTKVVPKPKAVAKAKTKPVAKPKAAPVKPKAAPKPKVATKPKVAVKPKVAAKPKVAKSKGIAKPQVPKPKVAAKPKVPKLAKTPKH